MEKAAYFKIGLFIIAGTIIAAVGVIALGAGAIFQTKTWIETYIDESVQGLDVGSPVKFRGVPVGKVEQISLTSVEYPTRRRYVMVRIGLTGKMFQYPLADYGSLSFTTEVEKGLRVRLASQGLTGAAYIEADYLEPTRNPPLAIDWQPRYPYVPSTLSRITQLSDAVEKILRSIQDVDLGKLVDGIEKSLGTITKVAEGANLDKMGASANAFLTEVRETNRQLKDMLASGDLKAALRDGAAAAKSSSSGRRGGGQKQPGNCRERGKAGQATPNGFTASDRRHEPTDQATRCGRQRSARDQRATTPNHPAHESFDRQPAARYRNHHE